MVGYVIRYGVVAGLIVGSAMLLTTILTDMTMGAAGMALGYATMLVALSLVFVAVKRWRDVEGGGVIGFWRAFGLGVAISAVAGLFYVLAWEVALVTTAEGFMAQYIESSLAQQEASGATPATLARARTEMEAFAASYRNPLVRMPLTFSEIFPVGLLVSLVSAAVLRNPRIMPARRTQA